MEEFLTEVATLRLEEVIARDSGVSLDKMKAESVSNISYHAGLAIMELFQIRDSVKIPKRAQKRILESMLGIVGWSGAIAVSLGYSLMGVEDIEEFAKDFESEICHDGILACLSIQTAVAELANLLYAEDGAEPTEEEVVQSVAELLALACIVSNRVGCSFTDLVTGSFK